MRLAHLSDFHLLARSDRPDWRIRWIAAGRPLDFEARYARAVRALRHASRADLVVLTGDLTETGSVAQFRTFADAMAEAQLDPDQVVFLPGNHDRYGPADAWENAFDGPLARFPHVARRAHGVFLQRQGLHLAALDVTRAQNFVRSTGFFTEHQREHLARSLLVVDGAKRHAVVALHHPPQRHPIHAWHWVNGLDGTEELYATLGERPRSLLHGHVHQDRRHRWGPHHVHAVPAVVMPRAEPPVTFHDVAPDGELARVETATPPPNVLELVS